MKVIVAYLRLYGQCLTKALKGISKNAWTLLLPIALAIAFSLIASQVGGFGYGGGIVLALLLDAVYSCYLYFTGEVVGHSRVTLAEFRKSIGVYFWSVMNLFFVLWLVNFALGMVLSQNQNRGVISFGVWLLTLIVLNASPEMIYLRGTRGGVETITRSVKFIQEHWIEWFIPNLVALGAAYLVFTRLLPYLPPLAQLAIGLVGGALFHVVMVFRGHLFLALDGSSHRQRMFQYRNTLRP